MQIVHCKFYYLYCVEGMSIHLLDYYTICARTQTLYANNENSDFFLTGRGVRQGDPISPILFNFVADVFTRILMRAAGHG
jgi:hypothetical protein